ncbi:MAG TPA: TIGR03668 family PPOX class F420-dependent oxidoreductase [Micromonosporaceae bacterium]|jgi:PPOX class probable F420-dependent enzyme|nr:TIGR03668 family PPOX class F420-dependent oxidoreductase [Micromonosporaceae bacterium]
MDIAWCRARFAEAPVARLATADEDGRPHLVPIVFVLVDDALYSAIDAKPKSSDARAGRLKRLDNIRANRAVSVLVDGYSDDWRQLWWARADGMARVLHASDEEAAGPLRALAARYPQYDEPPPGPVIAIAVRRWSGWAAAADSGRIEPR